MQIDLAAAQAKQSYWTVPWARRGRGHITLRSLAVFRGSEKQSSASFLFYPIFYFQKLFLNLIKFGFPILESFVILQNYLLWSLSDI